MRYAVWLLVVAGAVAEIAEVSWFEEEELEEPYDDYEHNRERRDVHDSGPYDEHVRVKRCDEPVYRQRRSAEYVRTPRQLHQYEVNEFNEEFMFPSPPYEEMLAASAEHYHRFQTPGAAKYTKEVSAGPVAFVSPVSSNNPVQVAASNVASSVVNPAYPSLPVNVGPVESAVVGRSLAALAPVPQLVQAIPDLAVAAGHHHHKHHHGGEHGGGHAHHGSHHGSHGGQSNKGYKSHHHVDKGNKGFKTDEHHRKEYEEAEGKKKKHHDIAGHKGEHEEEAFGQRGAHFGEKKDHKKGHKTKGYHNKYHKDEFHKEHKFYDDFHKSGEHHRYGKFNAKHASNESGKKKAHHVNAGHDIVERGKKGYSNKGHMDSDHKGHKGRSGHEEHHENHSQHGHKGGKEGGSHWGYGKQ